MQRLGTVSIKLLVNLKLLYGAQTLTFSLVRNIHLLGPREGILTHQWINSNNKEITNKAKKTQGWGLDSSSCLVAERSSTGSPFQVQTVAKVADWSVTDRGSLSTTVDSRYLDFGYLE